MVVHFYSKKTGPCVFDRSNEAVKSEVVPVAVLWQSKVSRSAVQN